MRQPLNGGRRIVSVSDGRQDINSTSDGRIMHGAFRSPPFSTGSETEGKAGRASFFFFFPGHSWTPRGAGRAVD